jgi:hypothetical protein
MAFCALHFDDTVESVLKIDWDDNDQTMTLWTCDRRMHVECTEDCLQARRPHSSYTRRPSGGLDCLLQLIFDNDLVFANDIQHEDYVESCTIEDYSRDLPPSK